MERIKKKWAAAVILMLVISSLVAERINYSSLEDGKITKNESGEGEEEIALILNAGDLLQNYNYSLMVEERQLSDEEAAKYIKMAQEEIAATFCGESESINAITGNVVIKDSYADGMVRAEWYFDNYEVIQADGTLNTESLTEEGQVVCAEVELTCQKHMEIYSFGFVVYARETTQTERLLQAIESQLHRQMENSNKQLELPREVNGVTLQWSMAKEHTTLKMLGLILAAVLLLKLVQLEERQKEKKKRRLQLQLDYPEIVSQFTVLIGAGMTIHQAWNKISARYTDKRDKKLCSIQMGYEELVITSREIQDGKEEQLAYQQFGERIALQEYRRFARILVQNIQKGSKGLISLLERETEEAYRERNMLAKRLGEEAGTKMLFPMIIMLGVVMAIVVTPAIMSF